MKAALGTLVASLVSSAALRDLRRLLASRRRRLGGRSAEVHYFHQVDDPYSHLLVQLLPALQARYRIELHVHLVPAPDDSAAPDRARLQAWSRRDAQLLAEQAGLDFADAGAQPEPARQRQAEGLLAAALQAGRFLELAPLIGRWLWQQAEAPHDLQPLPASVVGELLAAGATRRTRLGHYLGGTLYFESEWFWGLDRLDFLQARLQEAGLNRGTDVSSLARLPQVSCQRRPQNGQRPRLYFYASLRSPYTYLVAARVRRLADHYGAELVLRPLLPMAMRGLPVPLEKRLYILRDNKRIAEHFGLPFGKVADPLGRPTERGLALVFRALQESPQRGVALFESFLQGVWAEGIDAGSSAGLLRIARRAGFDQAFVEAALADDSWRASAERHRQELLDMGLWGVPSFRVEQGPGYWGQDRLWLVERELIAATDAR